MIRTAAIAALLVTLAACADEPTGNAYYQMGDANYDALKAASDACTTKGGTFQLRKGGEATHLGDYECVMPPKGKS